MVVGAVIVTYNPDIEELHTLIKKIQSSVKSIIVVDNLSNNVVFINHLVNSTNNTFIIELNQNKGIGYAQNRGIEFLFKDENIESIILFDHDSNPNIDMIDILSKQYKSLFLKNNQVKIGAVGPVYIDNRTNNHYPISVFSNFNLIKKYPIYGDNTPIYASFLIASGCLIHKSTLLKVGMMNEDFFIDYIDIEWSFRAQYYGYSLYACPNAIMYHKVGDDRLNVLGREISIHSPLRRYYLARNSILLLGKSYISWKYKVREVFYTISRVVVYLALVNNKRKYLKYILHGWYDGILGRVGVSKLSNTDTLS